MLVKVETVVKHNFSLFWAKISAKSKKLMPAGTSNSLSSNEYFNYFTMAAFRLAKRYYLLLGTFDSSSFLKFGICYWFGIEFFLADLVLV